MRLTHSLAMLLLGTPALLLLAPPAPALAQTSETAAPEATAAPAAATAFGHAADAGVLAGQRGGSDLVKNDMQLNGVTADNVAHNVSTGTNSIAGGSFAGASGLPIVIQNSGANVLIQNATILNLRMQ